ncbi:hypothetical protein CfE428DRAFT_6610 [Chthoniobacter flavus Ellin428]|uniref:WD40 domain protein beta Propeller n=1 Tax=Chthoniobacter flavus Ellin428 TaxID=497964 RepID=B4DCG9_9BACT|nr:hypothetical protein [Chthoniobacter flavus]EDY15878.1 hypothetical protein CfE428DRAFT_6610 [Chthoniobacter flavus Ellin428]TCO82205.1 hypothetical protein EV701_1481 [Chthoniobacter flavus]
MFLHLSVRVALVLFLALRVSAWGDPVPKGFLVPEDSLSPDGRYGVTVPILDEAPDTDATHNSVIEMKTGKILGAIRASTGWNRMNHGGVLPAQWSPDGSLLLWTVDGKWFFHSLVLLKMEKGRIAWQTDVLKAGQQAILARTKKAAPAKYAAAKKANAGNGSAYPEGFSVDVVTKGDLAFPLHVDVSLTSNPKDIPDEPTLESNLQGLVNERGEFVVTAFHLGRGHTERF